MNEVFKALREHGEKEIAEQIYNNLANKYNISIYLSTCLMLI